jgi:hypothetical protein
MREAPQGAIDSGVPLETTGKGKDGQDIEHRQVE